MPETTELILKAIEETGIAHSVTTRQEHLGQIACTEHVRRLFRQVYGILQHLQFRTVCHGLINVELRGQLHDSNLISLLVLKRHGLVQGQSAELVQQHAREHQSIVDLHQCHLGLVDLHVDTQTVALRSHALFDHLMYIAAEFLNKIPITLSQFLLMIE